MPAEVRGVRVPAVQDDPASLPVDREIERNLPPWNLRRAAGRRPAEDREPTRMSLGGSLTGMVRPRRPSRRRIGIGGRLFLYRHAMLRSSGAIGKEQHADEAKA